MNINSRKDYTEIKGDTIPVVIRIIPPAQDSDQPDEYPNTIFEIDMDDAEYIDIVTSENPIILSDITNSIRRNKKRDLLESFDGDSEVQVIDLDDALDSI